MSLCGIAPSPVSAKYWSSCLYKSEPEPVSPESWMVKALRATGESVEEVMLYSDQMRIFLPSR